VGKLEEVVTVNEPLLPTVNVAASALVIPGPSSTVRVKLWVASEPTPFEAVMVKE